MKKIRRICLSNKQVLKKEEMRQVVAGEEMLWLPESGEGWSCQDTFNAHGTIEDWTGVQLRVSAPNIAALIIGSGAALGGIINSGLSVIGMILDFSGYGLSIDLYDIAQSHIHNYLDGPHTPIGTKVYTFNRKIK